MASVIWHPFTQALTAPPPLPIVKGEGVYLYTERGEKFLDAISSWWVNLHGHAHPYIADKIGKQAHKLEHVIFAGCTHPQAEILAERLLDFLPVNKGRVFYSDNGSTAVETALKIAFQSKGDGKTLLSFQGAYHGDTFGAMAAAGKNWYNRAFWPYLFQVHSMLPPLPGKEEESWEEFEKALETGAIAAFIFEPLIQGAGGMRPYSLPYLDRMVQDCKKKGIIVIADEVMTGFGRTGPLFVSSSFTLPPDLICLSKGITGGFLPLGATIATEALYETFLSPDPSRAFLHGHSYTANPLACAAANASLDLLLGHSCTQARAMIETSHREFQQTWKSYPSLLRCDVIGTILVLEYTVPVEVELFQNAGILIRPLGNVLYILPPYCITKEELQHIYDTLEAYASRIASRRHH